VALSDLTDDQWLSRLLMKRAASYADQLKLWQYYDNCQPLSFVAKILAEQGDRFPPLLINWSALVVDALEERLDVLGFRDPQSGNVDDTLQQVWQDNDLDEGSGEAHTCSMVARQSFIMVGPPPAGRDTPLVTVEYPDQVTVEIDPGTRQTVAALKVWRSDPTIGHADMACLYVPGRVITFESGKKVEEVGDHGWSKQAEASQSSQLVPVVPMNNRQRRGIGYSELNSMLPVVDAANQVATNMLAAIEHHALPRRWGINLSESDFKDSNGNALRAWQIATGAVWAIPRALDEDGRPVPSAENERPQVGQFTAAELSNFHNSIKQIATIAASLYGLPPHYLGYSSENPASADAIRSSEARLVKRAERHQRGKGGAWETAMRIALAMMDQDPSKSNRLETVWRDASTPTKAAEADRAVKLVQANIIDTEQAQEDCGYTPGQRDRMRQRRGQATSDIGGIVANLRSLPVGGQQPPAEPVANPALNGATAGAGR
jgi:hypothetical protein